MPHRVVPHLRVALSAIALAALVFGADLRADTYPRQPDIDARHYAFRLTLLTSDSNDIQGEAAVTLRVVTSGAREAVLDFATPTAEGKGMTVTSVTSGGGRARLMEKIGDGAAIFLGATTPASDTAFRQGHDFFYMTGIDRGRGGWRGHSARSGPHAGGILRHRTGAAGRAVLLIPHLSGQPHPALQPFHRPGDTRCDGHLCRCRRGAQARVVFACDIQLFRLDEQVGIRIEDTVAITDGGYEVLSTGLPRTVSEIEALMKQDGMLQIFKKVSR